MFSKLRKVWQNLVGQSSLFSNEEEIPTKKSPTHWGAYAGTVFVRYLDSETILGCLIVENGDEICVSLKQSSQKEQYSTNNYSVEISRYSEDSILVLAQYYGVKIPGHIFPSQGKVVTDRFLPINILRQ